MKNDTLSTGVGSASDSNSASQYFENFGNLAFLNKILYGVTALVVAVFVANLFLEYFKLGRVGKFIASMEKQTAVANPESAGADAAGGAISIDPGLSNRNVFKPSSVSDTAQETAQDPAHYLQTSYKLVGISEGASKADTFVMVENVKTKSTFFLQYNKTVEGIQLEQIKGQHAIVKIGGTSVELE